MSTYDASLINPVINKFQNRQKHEPVVLLFDADNTLYRFSTYGMEQVSKQSMYTRNFYKNLPIFPEGPAVIENLQKLGFRCGILTSTIDSPYCAPEKAMSFEYHFPMISPSDIFILNPGVSKSETAIDTFGSLDNVILIDDYYGNINDWYEHGGVAIKKSYSGKIRVVPVVTSLIDLFYVLRELNAY